MIPVFKLVAYTAFAYAVFWIAKSVYAGLTSPIRYIAGPDRRGLVLGGLLTRRDVAQHMDTWCAQFGPTVKYPGVFGTTRLHTSGVFALQHILKNVDVYQRPRLRRMGMKNSVLGGGLLVLCAIECCDTDRDLKRKIMNPAFGRTPRLARHKIFLLKLRDNWLVDIAGQTKRIDVLAGLRNMTLDVIALADVSFSCFSIPS
ncbi:hypothetical protein C8R43DRAFT_1242572 [Mycena crocata]|nr:hypothetical protein C8R43DRAFT_1242572 [Mycena crocata]